jgi:hypothetical protein
MDSRIISLQQVAKNEWKAKFAGNRKAIHTISIKQNERFGSNRFSCNCSDSSERCKHITIVETAIDSEAEGIKNMQNQVAAAQN